MSEFRLMNSLLNPVVEAVEAPPAASAVSPVEQVTIDEAALKGGYRHGQFAYELAVSYEHESLPEPIYLTVTASLSAEYSAEDNSFGYEYGSERGTHESMDEYFSEIEWTNVTIPHVADNIELFKMEPEKVQHVTNFVTNYLTSMDSDAIAASVDVDKLVSLARPESGPDY